MEVLFEVIQDSFIDTLKLVPFLLVTYIFMEGLEHATAKMSTRVVRDAGMTGPFVGALLGALPQCGFSAAAATFFSGRVITLGTLIAVILSTSDEMLPVFIAQQAPLGDILYIIAIKVGIGMLCGFCIDIFLRFVRHVPLEQKPHIHELCEQAHCHCEHDEQKNTPKAKAYAILKSACIHTIQISLFIFLIELVLGFLFAFVGEQTLVSLIGTHPIRAVFICALLGLIPNCAASVAISELYLSGILAFPAMLAGLLVSGGVGLLVLFRTNRNAKENISIVGLLYAIGVVSGLICCVLGI